MRWQVWQSKFDKSECFVVQEPSREIERSCVFVEAFDSQDDAFTLQSKLWAKYAPLEDVMAFGTPKDWKIRGIKSK